jgi:endonuclease YncB( thermonuclease family)
MRLLPAGFVCLLMLCFPCVAVAGEATAAHATAANEITLADGRVLHLEGIGQPFPGGAWRGAAQKFLQDMMAGKQIAFEDAPMDRYGRLSAESYALDASGKKIWLQGEMLKAGLAFVYPPTGNEARLDEMRTLEAAARRTRTGIWADELYADMPADKFYGKEGQFAFVSGTVTDARRAKETVYIHFGENWRDTLTIAIAAHDLHKFRAANIDPLEITGKTVRVRGWVKHDIGPMITVTDPGQMEVLAKP